MPANKLTYEKFVKAKLLGLTPDETTIANALQSLEAYFDIAERLLSQNKWMAGQDFSLVDIYYIPVIQRLFDIGNGDLVTSREAVNDWWSRCVNRPAIKALIEGDRETVAVMMNA